MVTYDFPYTLIGHGKEILIRKQYDLNVGQASFDDLVSASLNEKTMRELHGRLVASQEIRDTELGGVVTLVQGPQGAALHFYEIPSTNGDFSRELHRQGDRSPGEFLSWLREEDNLRSLSLVQMSEGLPKKLISVLSNVKIPDLEKHHLIQGFVATYDLYSESRYNLSPYALKAFLGGHDLEGRYVGIFHFHNELGSPPSEADVVASTDDRQLVVSLARHGLVLYDTIHGKSHPIGVRIDA